MEVRDKFSPMYLNHGSLRQKISVLPMSYADPMIKEDWEGATKRIALKIINM